MVDTKKLRELFEEFKKHGLTMEEDLNKKIRKWRTSKQKLDSSQKVTEKRNKALHDQREESRRN